MSRANSGSSSSSSSVSKHETKPSKGKDVKPTTSNKKITFYNYGDPYTLTSKATLYDKNGQPLKTSALKAGMKIYATTYVPINGERYAEIADSVYIKESTFKGTDSGSQESSNHKNNDSGKAESPTGKRYNTKLTSTMTQPTITDEQETSARNARNEVNYMTDSQVQSVRDYLWDDIQNYRKDHGMKEFQNSSELDKLAYNAALPQTSEWKALNRDSNRFLQNINELKPFLPSLTANGMDMANGMMLYLNLGLYGQFIGFSFDNMTPKEIADQIFKVLTTQDDMASNFLREPKMVNPYGSLSMRFYLNGTRSTLGISFFTADSMNWKN